MVNNVLSSQASQDGAPLALGRVATVRVCPCRAAARGVGLPAGAMDEARMESKLCETTYMK